MIPKDKICCWNCGKGVRWREGDEDWAILAVADFVDCTEGDGMEAKLPEDECWKFVWRCER